MSSSVRMPTAFIPHGGGPWPFVEMGLDRRELTELADFLRALPATLPEPPKALLVLSAHWEEAKPTVQSAAAPPLLFDYYGFPAESYRLTWPAPGSPSLAARVRELLAGAGLASGEDGQRGFDHGTFVPLKLAWPNADVPVVQLSLQRGLDPATHLAIGRALAPLRDEGVFIVGSGMSFHNMRGFGNPQAKPISEAFDAWLQAAGSALAPIRDAQLTAWESAPGARLTHPREEHLLPMMVIAGAAGNDVGRVTWTGTMMGVKLSAYQWG